MECNKLIQIEKTRIGQLVFKAIWYSSLYAFFPSSVRLVSERTVQAGAFLRVSSESMCFFPVSVDGTISSTAEGEAGIGGGTGGREVDHSGRETFSRERHIRNFAFAGAKRKNEKKANTEDAFAL